MLVDRPIPRWLVPLVALCAGVSVANIYLAYPVLPLVAETFGIDDSSTQLIVTLGQVGYALGLFLLVPLGDVVRRKRLLALLIVGASIGLTVAAFTMSVALLSIATFMFCALTVAPHVLIPFVVSAVPRERQGRALATVNSAMIAGMVLSRLGGGLIGGLIDWHAVYAVAAIVTFTAGIATAIALPSEPPKASMTYPALISSTIRIFATQPRLRRAIAVQMPTFASFNLLWVSLVFLLTGPPYGLSIAIAGLFGLFSLSTVITAPFVGRLLDARGSRVAMGVGLGGVVAGAIAFQFSQLALPAVVVGLLLFQFGQQCLQVGNQSRILNLIPDARSRVNTLYMTSNFFAAALSSLLGAVVYGAFGWTGITVAALVLALTAFTTWLVTERRNPA